MVSLGMQTDDLVELERQFDSIYLNVTTFGCALLSAGGAIETCRAVTSQRVKNAIAVIRPPGHHAECNQPMGFCIFDNVSIAAKVCQLDYPETCRKILILDWYVPFLDLETTPADQSYLGMFTMVNNVLTIFDGAR